MGHSVDFLQPSTSRHCSVTGIGIDDSGRRHSAALDRSASYVYFDKLTHPCPTKNCAIIFRENIARPAFGPSTCKHRLPTHVKEDSSRFERLDVPIGCPYFPDTTSGTFFTVLSSLSNDLTFASAPELTMQ